MKKRQWIVFALLVFVLASCKKEDENKDENDTNSPTSVSKVIDVHADLLNWKYFSFATGNEVVVSAFDSSLTWDLGIRYESFRTNGGASGIGNGGVYDLGAVDFASVTLASIANQTIVADDSIQVIATMTPTWAKVPGTLSMEAMFASPAGPPPHTYTPNNHVYVIKTANGKHVKFLGTSFFNDLGAEGYLNFKYQFLD